MANRYAVGLVDWTGRAWDFSEDWAAGIKSGGVDDLVGTMVDTTASPLGLPGQMVLSQRGDVVTGSVTFHCRAHGGRDAGQVAADLRQAFSPLVGRRSLMTVNSPGGPVSAWVRRNGRVAAPAEDPSWGEMVLDVQVPLVADSGVWLHRPETHAGSVTVTNWGDVPLWVSIRWVGPGGEVVLPSGARFTLPAVAQPRTLHLRKSPTVVGNDGVRDEVLWRQLRAVPPEMVPVDQVREFSVPEGAELIYQVGVIDPWQ